MSVQLDFVPIDAGVLAGSLDEPVLLGSACDACGTVTFPRQDSCPRCTSQQVAERRLGTRGTLWSWTIQCFPPKSPPYAVQSAEDFDPYGVGYIELPGEVRVEARLTESDPERLQIGMPMKLTLIEAPGREGVMTFAFRPLGDDG